AQAKGLTLEFALESNIPQFVYGDEGKLRQILLNLLSNAVKFTQSGSIVLRARWQEEICYFEVEDTGYGISDEEMTKLFQPFVQTSSGQKSTVGTGLGLAISKSFLKLMGGDISVESELKKGTTFSLHLRLPQALESKDQ